MFLVGSIIDRRVRRILRAAAVVPFSYEGVGRTLTLLPGNREMHRSQFRLGEGSHVFYKAKEAVQRWRMFDVPWVRVYAPEAPIKPGTTAAVLAGICNVWIVNLCRVVYVIDDPRRYGFAYGTLPQHVVSGEERFVVEWREDNSVWYEVLAFSTLNYWFAKLAPRITRRVQRRFRRESGEAMQKAAMVAGSGALRI